MFGHTGSLFCGQRWLKYFWSSGSEINGQSHTVPLNDIGVELIISKLDCLLHLEHNPCGNLESGNPSFLKSNSSPRSPTCLFFAPKILLNNISIQVYCNSSIQSLNPIPSISSLSSSSRVGTASTSWYFALLNAT